MFIKHQTFKRLINEAYKTTGLKMLSTQNTLCLAGSFWVMEMQTYEIPNKHLASIIEIIGRLPKPGESCTIKKGRRDTDGYSVV